LARIGTVRVSKQSSFVAKLAILSRPCHHLGHGGIEKTASSARSAVIASTSRRDQASM
jgi:hypothetical protein